MVELNFNPQIGEHVQRVLSFPSDPLFEIVDRRTNSIGELLLKLRRLQDGELFDNISAISVEYPLEDRIRRALRGIFVNCDSWPDDFQKDRFDVESDQMYDGTPRIMVHFYLKPEVVPSAAKARIWSGFYSELRKKLQFLNPEPWLQFMAREERGALSAAS
ncbi:MAG TPA: hypothetical protein VE291_12715 [Terracidiphilus sp.]|jgi:hypothetical protein|nr:hypothetical protein [Terracidiphilus sp.]